MLCNGVSLTHICLFFGGAENLGVILSCRVIYVPTYIDAVKDVPSEEQDTR